MFVINLIIFFYFIKIENKRQTYRIKYFGLNFVEKRCDNKGVTI